LNGTPLVSRARNGDDWDLTIGGDANVNENGYDAAVRELNEEVGQYEGIAVMRLPPLRLRYSMLFGYVITVRAIPMMREGRVCEELQSQCLRVDAACLLATLIHHGVITGIGVVSAGEFEYRG
jgi:8-oxo-dGTP pyrophosphatase MutT (NUDIX family)